MIPKIIHYCWFGGELPELAVKCIKSWGKIWPEYEVVRWDESNVPSSKYINRALRLGKYANASNLARFYALRGGGIYLDVDIEAYRDFGVLLEEGMFMGWQDHKQVNNAVMGAVSKHLFVEACIERFESRFDASERANISSPFFITEMLQEYYGEIEPEVTKNLGDVTLLANDFFYPSPPKVQPRFEHVTANTVCLHHWMKSWK